MNRLQGADISHHQGEVNFVLLATSGIAFIYVKATEGERSKDSRFPENWENAGESPFLRGAYHFYHTNSDPIGQADNFIAAIRSLPTSNIDLPPMLDIEEPDPVLNPVLYAAAIQKFCLRVYSEIGKKVIIYSNSAYWDQYIKSTAFRDSCRWVATYSKNKPKPFGEGDLLIWQYTGKGSIIGVKTEIDLNWFYGDLKTLFSLTAGQLIKSTKFDPKVKVLQSRLKYLGLYAGKNDGFFGALTENAVMSFQTKDGLNASGIVGPETWESLFNFSNTPE